MYLGNSNMIIYIYINISFIFIKRFNFPFTNVVFFTERRNCSLIPDKIRCLRATVATYLAYLAVHDARALFEFICRPSGLFVQINQNPG